ncbi:MAG: putative Ig domain-containing protein [Thermomicrobiales bacterium]
MAAALPVDYPRPRTPVEERLVTGFLQLVNAERAARGLPALAASPDPEDRWGAYRAQYTHDNCSASCHARPSDETPYQALLPEGWGWRGEVSFGHLSARSYTIGDALIGFMGSSGHRDILLGTGSGAALSVGVVCDDGQMTVIGNVLQRTTASVVFPPTPATPVVTGAGAGERCDVPPVLTSSSPPTSATVGAGFGPYTFRATGNPAPAFTVGSGSLPAGLSLNSTSGVLSGTPTAAGTFTFTVRASNGVNPAAVSTPKTITVAARSGYWMLGSTGSVYGFGEAAQLGAPTGIAAANIAQTPSGNGYWIVSQAGAVHAYGDATVFGGPPALRTGEKVSSLSPTPTGSGYWLYTNQGRALPYGTAAFFGDVGDVRLDGPVLGSVSTPSGNGYYMVASDGGIFAFGDAAFAGSMGGQRLAGPVVGIAPDPDGVGYWLVASDGGIFAFSAGFRGSMGGTRLSQPMVGMVAYGDGYLMVASDGGIFNFSTRPFRGSLGDRPPPNPIIAVAPLNR